jgi:hypothetical protein
MSDSCTTLISHVPDVAAQSLLPMVELTVYGSEILPSKFDVKKMIVKQPDVSGIAATHSAAAMLAVDDQPDPVIVTDSPDRKFELGVTLIVPAVRS